MKKLSQVYVTSTGDNPIVQRKEKELPKDCHTHEEYMYGIHEPIKIPYGKLSLRQVVELLDKYATDPVTNTPEKLASDYKIDLKLAIDMTTYFRPFKVHLPPKKEKQTGVARVKEIISTPFYLDMKKDAEKHRKM